MSKISLKRLFALLLAAAVVSTTAAPVALAEEETTPPGEPPQTEWSLTLDKEKTVALGTDSTLSVKVNSQPADSTPSFAWSVDKAEVLSLENTDKAEVTLKPLKTGTAKVSVTVTIEDPAQAGRASSEKTATCDVTVSYANATGVAVSSKNETVDVGKAVTLTASVSPDFADPNGVTWTVENGGDVVSLNTTSGNSVTVTGKKPGEAKLTAKAGTETDSAQVTVRGVVLNKTSLTLYAGATGEQLSATGYGDSVAGAAPSWSSGNASVAFVDANGKVTGQSVGSTVITVDMGGYTAKCDVTVRENTATNISAGGVPSGQAYSLSQLCDDLNSQCRSTLGSALFYVTNLSVNTEQGTLYYQYNSADDPGYGVGSTEKYYYEPKSSTGRRDLADVVFVPDPEFSGTAKVNYTGFDSGNRSFKGEITFSVEETSSLSYSIRSDQTAAFLATDFNTVCRKTTGRDLQYVTFQLPAADRGTLYYNYAGMNGYSERVQAGTKYGRTQNPYLNNVSFVPAEGYTGTVRISYTGVDTAGRSYTGRVTITVSNRSGTEAGDLNYTASRGRPVTFKSSDFNTLCQDVLDRTLDYVKFELPSESRGVLYYDYTSSSNYGSKVSASKKYYRSGTPSISKVTFVPASGAGDSVSISFTAYDLDGYSFEGWLVIKVTGNNGDGEVRYSGISGQAVEFNAADFNELCLDVNDETLRYVTFDLPSSSQGTLYYNYTSSSNYGSKVSSSSKYYRSGSPSLSNVAFVPKSGFSGVVYIEFSGYDVDGGRFDGTVIVTVEDAEILEPRYTVANTGVLSMDSGALDSICKSVTGRSLDYVRFQLPTSSRGTLYYQYDAGKETYASKVSSGTNYYRAGARKLIDDVSFVPASGFTGTVTLGYTGWDSAGRQFDGTLRVDVVRPVGDTIRYTGSSLPVQFQSNDFYNVCRALMGRDPASVRFTSLPSAAEGVLRVNYKGPLDPGTPVSVGTSYSYTASPGIGQISFVPKAGFQGIVTIPCSVTDTAGKEFTGNIEIVLSNAYGNSSFTDMAGFGWAVPSVEFLRQYGIAAGYGSDSRYAPGENIGRGDFVLMLCRAFDLSSNGTSAYRDVPAGSYYANAIAAATELGIVSGYGGGRFGPADPLTRQDAMVMVMRALQATGRGLPAAPVSDLSVFWDNGQIADYARPAAAALVRAGVIKGGSGGKLEPRSAISRAEMAVILHRVLTL